MIVGALAALLGAEQILFRLALLFMCFHLVRVSWLARRLGRRNRPITPPPLPDPPPLVTVQLPLYNEYYVAEEVIRAAAALDWPADRLEIQILDDSDDETAEVVNRTVEQCRRAGGPAIDILRRDTRAGFKAGALAYGLERARGELIAIFDADCSPAPDFLRRTVPHLLADERVGMVQGRWTFSNRDHSLMTRLQALLLQSLMLVEQVVRSQQHRPFQFNGTAGIWRRACIEDAGGWRDDSVAEDLELSFRALLRRWRFVQLPEVEVRTELPEGMTAFRVQQRRWVRGNFEVLRRLGSAIVASARPLRYRLSMLVHVGRRLLMAMLAVQTITLPLTTFGWIAPPLDFSLASSGALAGLCVLALGVFLWQGQAQAGGRPAATVPYVPVVVGMTFGLSLCYSHSMLAGLLGRRGEFVSTPKHGGAKRATGPRYSAPVDWWCLAELVAGCAHLVFMWWALGDRLYAQAFFFCFLGLSFLAVGCASLRGLGLADRRPLRAPRDEASRPRAMADHSSTTLP